MFGRIGTMELLLISGLVLIVFGPKNIPKLGRTMGKSLSEFRQAAKEIKEAVNIEDVDLTK